MTCDVEVPLDFCHKHTFTGQQEQLFFPAQCKMNGISRSVENCSNHSRINNDYTRGHQSDADKNSSRTNPKSRNKGDRNKEDEYQRAKREV